MGTIRRTLDSCNGDTDTTVLTQCVDGRYPQINELWCLGLNGIFREVHFTARVDILAGTVG